jgi:hypothetical protein
MSVLNAARSFTDNITDSEELDRAISYAVTFLTNNPLVAQVVRNENSVYVTFKSGSSAGIFGSLAGKRAPAGELLEITTKQIVVENLRGAQPPQGRAAVVLSPFHWQDSSDPSYAIYDNYMVSRLYPSTYSAISYVPNDYVTLDEVANFFLGWHISDFSWVVNDNGVPHLSHGMFSMTTHGGIFNGYTVFLTGECYDGPGCGTPKQPTRGSGIADYNAYYSYDSASVFIGLISGDSRSWIAFSSAFVWDFMYAADYSSGEMNSLFYANACESLKQADMAEGMAGSGIYTYLGWTESVHYPDPSDYALDIFFNGLTSGKTAAQAYQDVKNAWKDYDLLSPFAHLYYYPGPDTIGSPWFSSGNHGDWTVSWPNTYPHVSTDKMTYAQLESILFTGTGFTPGGSVLSCLSTDNDGSLICSAGTYADGQGKVNAGTMQVGTNIPVGPQKFMAVDVSTGKYSNAAQLSITSPQPPAYSAEIVSDDIPASIIASQEYVVHVTIRNTGTNVWTASAGYKLGSPGDSDPFAPARVELDPSASVGYGQSYTFTFTMTAPSSPGSYVTDWRMLRELVTWFGGTLSKTVRVTGVVATNDAAITGNDIPTTMTAGQSYAVHVTVQNMGTTTWTAAAGYKLGAVGDSDPFAPTRILLDPSDSIGSGQSKTFTFTMTAPSTAGSYVTDWRMVREFVAWFGATLTVQVTVEAAAGQYGAVITANDMPTSMIAGQTYTVHIAVQNTGTNTWTAADGYKLGAAGDVNPFGPTRILLDPSDSIATGQSKTFTFTLTAPSTPRTYTVTWRMLRELVTWFGGSSKVSVSVSSGVRNAAIVSNDMPTTMVAGQTYTVHITVQNTGTTTWTAAGNYKLGFVGDHPPFGPSRILLDGSASVAPGQQYTFTFTLTAPTTPGTYTMQYRMLQELVTWFGQSTTTTVTVQ